MRKIFIPAILIGCLAANVLGASPAAAAADSSLIQTVRELIADSLAGFRDSLAAKDRKLAEDSLGDVRPARAYLRTAQSEIFATAAGSVTDDYPLGPGDVLVLTIWGQKQARYDLEVDRDGQIQIPSAGTVNLNGATFGMARGMISRKLSTVYSGVSAGFTQFDLTIAKLKQVRVFVVGEVKSPGGYLLPGATSVLQAVAIAGGPTAKGSDRVARIVEGDHTRDIDLYQYLFLGRRPSGDVLHEGQVIRIPPALGVAEVRGGAARPGLYEVLPGESSSSLLQLAGGLSAEGLAGQPMNLVRRSGSGTYAVLVGPGAKELGGQESSPVGPGDVLEVPVQGTFARTSPVISGAVARPGTYPYTEGMDVNALLELAGGPAPSAILDRVLVYRSPSVPNSTVERVSLAGGSDLRIQPTDSVVVGSREGEPAAPRTVEIEGAVKRPGSYKWSHGMTIKDLLALAGGFESWAALDRVRLDAPGVDGAKPNSRILSLDPSLAIGSAETPLPPFAKVNVGKANGWIGGRGVKVQGLVAQPGTFALLAPRERVSSLMARAGGLLPEAYAGGAILVRPSEGRIPFDLAKAMRSKGSDDDVELLDGDSIDVPWRPSTVVVKGEVNKPNAVLWRKGKPWSWYVENAGGFTDSARKKAVFVEHADGAIQTAEGGIDDPTPGSVVVVPRLEPPKRATSAEKISAFGTIASALAALVTAWAIYQTVDNK